MGWKGVVPKETDAGAHKGRHEDQRFTRIGDVHDVQVISKDDGAGHVGQNAQSDAHNGGSPCGQSIDAIGQIGSVGNRCDNEDDDRYEYEPCPTAWGCTPSLHELGIVQFVVFEEGYGGFGRMVCFIKGIAHRTGYPLFDRDLFFDHHLWVEEQDSADDDTKDHLAEHFEDAPQSLFILLEYLDVVVQESDEAHPYRGDHEQLDVHIVQLGKEQGGNENGREDEEPAHGRCPGFFLLSFESEVPNGLTHLQFVQ